jgi:hypothetical protein
MCENNYCLAIPQLNSPDGLAIASTSPNVSSQRWYLIKYAALVMLFLVSQMALATTLATWFLDEAIARELPGRIQGSLAKLIVGNDSWKPMNTAYEEVRSKPEADLYEKVFFHDRVKFHYPPTALLYNALVDQFHPLAPTIPRYWFYFRTSAALSYIAFAVIMLATWGILRDRVRIAGEASGKRSRWISVTLGLLSSVLCFVFFPLVHGMLLGQIQIFLDASFCLILYCFLRGSHQRISGVLLGLMSLVKPQYGLLVVWGVVRKRWNFAVPAITTGVLALAISVFTFGWRSHIGYLDVIAHVGSRGEAFIRNQSVNGLLNRFFQTADAYTYDSLEYAPIHPVVRTGTMLTSLALVAGAIWFTWRRKAQKPDASEVSLWVLVATLASPIALDQHFGVLIAVYAVLFADMLNSELSWRETAMVGVSFFFVGNLLPPRPDQLTPWLSLIHSEVLYGALILLALLYIRASAAAVSKTPLSMSHAASASMAPTSLASSR